jgi:hypothetical protein
MKLYHNGQLEGWQVPGKQDKRAERIDVPSSPAELAAWLNHRRVGPTGIAARLEELEGTPGRREEMLGELLDGTAESDEPQLASAPSGPRVPGFCDACGRSAAGALKLSQGRDVDTVVAWVMEAESWQLTRIAEAINEHAAELQRAAGRTN